MIVNLDPIAGSGNYDTANSGNYGTVSGPPAGRPAVELSGTVETARDAIALNTEKAGSMMGNVKSKGADAFDFTLVGAPKEAKPLEFQRQK